MDRGRCCRAVLFWSFGLGFFSSVVYLLARGEKLTFVPSRFWNSGVVREGDAVCAIFMPCWSLVLLLKGCTPPQLGAILLRLRGHKSPAAAPLLATALRTNNSRGPDSHWLAWDDL